MAGATVPTAPAYRSLHARSRARARPENSHAERKQKQLHRAFAHKTVRRRGSNPGTRELWPASGMRILVDGDVLATSCIFAIVALARRYEVECIIIAAETRKPLDSLENAWITVPSAPDSADTAILNILRNEDIVITDDGALGWKCCDKGAMPIRADGGTFDLVKDPMRFWRKRKLRVLCDGERERVKAIKTRLIELRLASAIASFASGAFANDGREEAALLAELHEINKRRIWDSAHMRAEESIYRESIYRYRYYYMPEFDKKPKSQRKTASARKPRFTRPKHCVSDREREVLREMREIADEYETRFQISRRASLIETRRREVASPAETTAEANKNADFAEREQV